MKLHAFFWITVLSLLPMAHAADKLRPRPRYVLHAGDTIELEYRLSPELNQTVTLEPDGHANLRIAGDLLLSGLTVEEARELILQKVDQRLNKPELNLILKEFEKPYVVVGGEVQLPGRFELRQDMTALQALILAGGAKESAKATHIVLFRHINGDMGEVHVLNLDKIRKTKQLEQDMRLEAGDMLLVPANNVETFSRYMKAANFGTFLSPNSF